MWFVTWTPVRQEWTPPLSPKISHMVAATLSLRGRLGRDGFKMDCGTNLSKVKYRSYSVIRRTVFFKKFLISTKNYRQSLGASYSEYFPDTNFFYHSYWYDFKQIKGHTVLVIDFYKCGGSEKNRLSCVMPGVYSSSLSLSVSNSLSNSSSASRMSPLSLSSS